MWLVGDAALYPVPCRGAHKLYDVYIHVYIYVYVSYTSRRSSYAEGGRAGAGGAAAAAGGSPGPTEPAWSGLDLLLVSVTQHTWAWVLRGSGPEHVAALV